MSVFCEKLLNILLFVAIDGTVQFHPGTGQRTCGGVFQVQRFLHDDDIVRMEFFIVAAFDINNFDPVFVSLGSVILLLNEFDESSFDFVGFTVFAVRRYEIAGSIENRLEDVVV